MTTTIKIRADVGAAFVVNEESGFDPTRIGMRMTTMTMPQERFRAIGWARDFLRLVAADINVPEDIRRQASKLQADFPTDSRLRQVIRDEARYLPHDVGAGLQIAAELVHGAWPASAATLEHRRLVRRHFPTAFEVHHECLERDERLARALGGVPQWIWPGDEN